MGAALLHSGDPGRGLIGESQLQLGEQELLLRVGFGAAAQQEFAPVGGGEMHLDHLDFSKVVEGMARGQTGGLAAPFFAQGDMDAVEEEADHDVGFDAAVFLMINGPHSKVSFLGAQAGQQERAPVVAGGLFRIELRKSG